MNIEDKKAWLDKHGTTFHRGSGISDKTHRSVSVWFSRYTGKEFQGVGYSTESADDRVFNRIYEALLILCVDNG